MSSDPAHFHPAAPAGSAHRLVMVLVTLALLLALLPALLILGPRRLEYELDAESLRVTARLGPLDLGRQAPRTALGAGRVVSAAGVKRLAGSELPGFCHGRWYLPEVGDVWMASSCTPELVLLPVAGEERPWALSPVDPEAFLAALPQGRGRFEVMPSPPPSPIILASGLFVVAMLTASATLLWLSPRRLRYELREGELLIHTAWGQRRVSLAGARVGADPTAKPTLRLFGIGLPGHQVGRFRVSGRIAQIYLTNRQQAVWVEPAQGLPVLLSPAAPGAFVAAAIERGAAPRGA